MCDNKFTIGNSAIRRVTWTGVWVNVVLGVVKFIFGIMVNSIALTSDGVHSLSDLASDAAVLLGVHMASKKPDSKHPYGHGRMETFSAIFISAALLVLGGYMIYYAGIDIARGNISKPSITAIVISVFSVLSKESLFHITKKAAVEYDSSMLYANAWHHRSDALSSVAVILGISASFIGFDYGDQIAGIAVGVMIIIAGSHILGGCLRELSEESVDKNTVERIKSIIEKDDGIAHWHNLRTRTVGREIFIDLHILVDPDLNICQAHDIADRLEDSVHKNISRPVNITVHIEPDIENLRK